MKRFNSKVSHALIGGRYFVCDTLGRGGMCIVRLAFDLELFQFVAIKSLFKELSELDEYVLRFQREQSIYGQLSHPHIVRLVDFNKVEQPYIALEYVSGAPLSAYVKGKAKTLPIGRVLRYFGDLAGAVAAVHEKQIIHRDIKPDNIIIDQDGCIKLIDFGVAAADDGLVETETGVMVGTRSYASPEQNQGQNVGPASDLWSLGVTFWEVLTGQRLFSERLGAVISELQFAKQIEPPSAYNEEIPKELDELFVRLLQTNRSKRLSSAKELSEIVTELRRHVLSAKEPHPDDLRFECAHIALHRMIGGDLNGAEAVLAAAPSGKSDGTIQFLLGKLAWRQGLKFKALDYVRRAISLNPDELLYRADLARILLSFNMFNQAAKVVEEAQKCEQESKVLRALATLLEQGRKYLSERRFKSSSFDLPEDDCTTEERKTHRAMETARTIQTDLGRMALLVKEGAYAAAIAHWKKLGDEKQKSDELRRLAAYAHLELGRSFLSEGTFEKASTQFQRAIECKSRGEIAKKLNNTVVNALIEQAKALRHEDLGQTVVLIEKWRKLLDSAGYASDELQKLLGNLLLERGRRTIRASEDLAVDGFLTDSDATEKALEVIDQAYTDLSRVRNLLGSSVEPHLACAGEVRAELRYGLFKRLHKAHRVKLLRASEAIKAGNWSIAIDNLTLVREGLVVGRPHFVDRMLVDAHSRKARAKIEAALLDLHEGIISRQELGEALVKIVVKLETIRPVDEQNLQLEDSLRRKEEIEQQTGCALTEDVLSLVSQAEVAAASGLWDKAIGHLLDCFEQVTSSGAPTFLRHQLANALTNRAEASAIDAIQLSGEQARKTLENSLQDLADATFFQGDSLLIAKARERIKQRLASLSS